MKLRFSVGERVKIVVRDVVGEVMQTEYRHMIHKGSETIWKRYYVKPSDSKYSQWFNEDDLGSLLELSYPEQVNKVLIDVALSLRDFEMVKRLQEEIK